MSPVFPRDLAPAVQRIAQQVYTTGVAPRMDAGNEISISPSAPAINTRKVLTNSALVPGTLELTRASDSYLYIPSVDYTETPDGFLNLRIPAGTLLNAEFAAEEEPQPRYRFEGSLVRIYTDPVSGETVVNIEPKTIESEAWNSPALLNGWVNVSGYNTAGYYRNQGRVYLKGRISSGTVAVGTELFSGLAGGYRPATTESLPGRSNAGPVQIEVTSTGIVRIGDGPFEAGNGWLSLDGLSYRALTGYGARYPNTNRYPNVNRYPN